MMKCPFGIIGAMAALAPAALAQQYYLVAGQNSVERYALDGTYIGTFASGAGVLPAASQMTLSPDGSRLYVGTYNSAANVAVFDVETGESLGPIETDGTLTAPSVVKFSKAESLLVSDFLGGEIYEYDPVTNEQLGAYFSGVTFRNPHEILETDDGYLVSDYGENRVSRFNADGEFVEHVLSGVSDGLRNPLDMLLSDSGDLLYVSNNTNSRVSVFDTSDYSLVNTIGVGDLRFPEGIAWGADGSLLVANAGQGEILSFDALSGELLGTFGRVPGLARGTTDIVLVPTPGTLVTLLALGVPACTRRR